MDNIINKVPDLKEYLYYLMSQIPDGKITTFKMLSEALGSKYAVKFVLNHYKKHNNWYKVVNEQGTISNPIQAELLKKEGVKIKNNRIENFYEYIFKDFDTVKPLETLRMYQNKLKRHIILKDDFNKLSVIGGVDISYINNLAYVVYVILDEDLNLITHHIFKEKINFPYIPTFLSFREGEPIIKTFKKVEKPDILFVNGQGIAHPTNMGLATYVGIILDIPTIGITKRHLFGNILGNRIYINNRHVGWVIKKDNKKIFASPGNKVSLDTVRILSEKFWIKGNYPEPIRLADEMSKKVKT